MEEFVEVESRGILVHEPEDDPVLLLAWAERSRVMPVWLGAAEAASLAARESGMMQNRPGSPEVIVEMAEACGNTIDRAEITGYHEGVFIAALVLDNGNRVDVRVSDAVAVCEVAEVPLVAARDVAEAASVPAAPLFDGGGAAPAEAEEASVEEFAKFLEGIDADDFLGNGGDTIGNPGNGGGTIGNPGNGPENDTDVTDDDSSDGSGTPGSTPER